MYTIPTDFLREIFPPSLEGIVRIAIATPSPEGFRPKHGSFPIAALHRGEDIEFDIEVDRLHNFFFTPHPYQEAGDWRKDNAALMTQCLYMDCDDEDISPAGFKPPPSIVVETSKKKHHCYWLLEEPIETTEAERLNKALAYHYLSVDRGGWDRSQLLRIPGFSNTKYDPVQSVKVVDVASPMTRYTPDDFIDIPQAPADMAAQELPTPDEDTLPKRRNLKDKFSEQWPKKLDDVLDRRSKDRSGSLWYLYNQCFRMGMTRDEVFALALESVNNKFTIRRYNQSLDLWHDCGRAHSQHQLPEDERPILRRIDDLRKTKMPHQQRTELLADMLFKDMEVRGRFYYIDDEIMSAFHYNKRLYDLSKGKVETGHLLYLLYGLNATTGEYNYLRQHFQARACHEGTKVTLRTLAHFNVESGTLYISDHNDQYHRTNGIEQDIQVNGLDGVYFLTPKSSRPYTPIRYNYTGTEEGFSLLDELIFTKCKFNAHLLNPDDAQFLVRVWFYSLFFADLLETKPMLILEGDKGSGKTTLFKSMAWLLYGPSGSVSDVPFEEAQFKEMCRNQSHLFLDGIDNSLRWLPNALSTIATGVRERRRILYTNNDMAEYRLQCSFGITTMSAQFMRDDIADRAIILATRARETFKPEGALKAEILHHRNQLWHEIIWDLHKVVKLLREEEEVEEQLRMADFAPLLIAACRHHNRNPKHLIRFMKKAQTQAVLERDVFMQALLNWLSMEKNLGLRIKPSELYRKLAILSDDPEFTKVISSSIKLGQKLQEVVPVLAAQGYELRFRQPHHGGGRLYVFFRIDDEGGD